MSEKIYIVAPNKSISTRAGIKSAGEEISNKIIGNWNRLIELGYIIEKEALAFKNNIQEMEMNFAKPEKKIEDEAKTEVKKRKKITGAQKKTEDEIKTEGNAE